ncbi:MAG: hypothetical protein OEL80_06235, partial [Desulfuromonadales bacterium]|nr:hypothetical protein [Desulfuromonadales bacterium]
MPLRTGLRTEIILSISLLLAAALLFAGFLLVKLTERNLLDQQRAHDANIIQLVAAGVDQPYRATGAVNNVEIAVASLDRLQTVLARQADITAWRLLDTSLQVLTSTAYHTGNAFANLSPSTLEKGELYEELVYQSYRPFIKAVPESYLDLATPLWIGDEPYGLLQIRFSLEGLHQRVQQAQRLTLLYVIVYGLVLAAFGVYLLNRNIV